MSRRIVVYGTSLSAERTWFWRRTGGSWVGQTRARLTAEAGRDTEVINRAQWGADSDWGVRNLGSRVLALAPDAVTVEFAVNDAETARAIPPGRSRENLERMVHEIGVALPRCEIFVLTTNPVFGRYRDRRPLLERYYQQYRDVASGRRLRLIDLHLTWDEALRRGGSRETLLPDGIHPSPEGCRAVVLPEVLGALGTVSMGP